MQSRRSIRLPILLAVGMIVITLALTAGWVVLAVRSALQTTRFSAFYWTLLSVGSIFFVLIVVGVVIYLILSIKAINITRRQSNFIDSVTHELKSPIASLKLYVQTLRRRDMSPGERADFYQSMLEDVERLDELINHILDAARLDKPAPKAAESKTRLDELLRRCATLVVTRYKVPESSVNLKLQPAIVSATEVDLELIFRNLLDNAVKYSGDPPDVLVDLQVADRSRIRVRVQDNGQGIPHNLRQKVFGRFVRLGNELEREKTGLGLGLYIVRTMVARIRGQIRVREADGGPGTTFEVLLRGKIVPKEDIDSP